MHKPRGKKKYGENIQNAVRLGIAVTIGDVVESEKTREHERCLHIT